LTGLKRWPTTAWRTLLDLALEALDELGPEVEWAFGGGTALSLVLDHRVSYDVDIFLEDAGNLRKLSPNRNEASRAITDVWQEPGHYLKLERDEGEIDFIVASRLTACDTWSYSHRGRDIPVEDPAEILAKKLQYRGSRFIPRDIFDLLAIHRHDPGIVEMAVQAVPEGAERAVDRIRRIHGRYLTTISDEVNPTSRGLELLDIDPSEAADILEGFLKVDA